MLNPVEIYSMPCYRELDLMATSLDSDWHLSSHMSSLSSNKQFHLNTFKMIFILNEHVFALCFSEKLASETLADALVGSQEHIWGVLFSWMKSYARAINSTGCLTSQWKPHLTRDRWWFSQRASRPGRTQYPRVFTSLCACK